MERDIRKEVEIRQHFLRGIKSKEVCIRLFHIITTN